MASKNLYVVVSVAFQDFGDTTRAIAIMKAFRDLCPSNVNLKVDFLSCGSNIEYLITNANFNIVRAEPRVKGISVREDLGLDFPEFFGSPEIVKTFIDGQLAAFKELKPDIVFHGMFAPASLAARLLGIRTINFLPLPLHPGAFGNGLIRDLPDPMPLLTRLPRPVRQKLAWWGSSLLLKAPIFRQHRVGAAAAASGWPVSGPISLFDMNMADLNLVNDHPTFHTDYMHRLPKNIVLTGPIWAQNDSKLDEDIIAHLDRPGSSIVVAMGSSSTKGMLFEAIRAMRLSQEDQWNAVILAPRCICTLEEALEVAGEDERLLVTDRFIPAPAAKALADVVVIHGGQGTVQTAVAAGKPIVGVGHQLEQQTNLDNVMDAGAGIRIQYQCWRARNIRNAVRQVLNDPSYTRRATMLANEVNQMDGALTAGEAMWEFALSVEEFKA
ncbi:unnamed protein product [Periconia digitata]|uniref:Erythromycin biosynthesis protein CIII-like C-terminal domain-containing protein n=1 Tax=Periconia digitata TaxID=1303443 RepID=A0A9W4UKH8_9PLEO|nr:unnamed protein product [Periconia digitata]